MRARPRWSCATRRAPSARAAPRLTVLRRRTFRIAPGRDRGAGRPVGRRQIDAAACRRSAGAARQRRGAARRHAPAAALGDHERTRLRRAHLGFVYQFHHLLPEFSALENVMLPQMIAGKAQGRGARPRQRAAGEVGLAPRADAPPGAAFGRRAAARRHRPRARQRAARAAGRRADRQSRSAHRRRRSPTCAAATSCARRGLAALIATHNLDLARRCCDPRACAGGRTSS